MKYKNMFFIFVLVIAFVLGGCSEPRVDEIFTPQISESDEIPVWEIPIESSVEKLPGDGLSQEEPGNSKQQEEVDEYGRIGYYEGCESFYVLNLDDRKLKMACIADNYKDFVVIYTDLINEFPSDFEWATRENPHKLGETVNLSFIWNRVLKNEYDGNYYVNIDEEPFFEYDIDISILGILRGEAAVQKAYEISGIQIDFEQAREQRLGDFEVFMVNYTWLENIEIPVNNRPDVNIGIADSGNNWDGLSVFIHTEIDISITNYEDETKWRLITSYNISDDYYPVVLVGSLFYSPPEMRIIYFGRE